jgi:hypothetical protein
MICRLQRDERDFTIILRTMGIDSSNFLDNVSEILDGKHQLFPDIKPMNINRNIGQLKRYDGDKIELEMDGETFKDQRSIYQKLNSLTGNLIMNRIYSRLLLHNKTKKKYKRY